MVTADELLHSLKRPPASRFRVSCFLGLGLFLLLAGVSGHASVSAQVLEGVEAASLAPAADAGDGKSVLIDEQETSNGVMKVMFGAMPIPKAPATKALMGATVMSPACVPGPVGGPAGKQSAQPAVPKAEIVRQSGHVTVTIMKGEVHMRNLNSKMGSGEILNVTAGDRSACEFRLGSSIGRVWANSDVTVFASSNVILLNHGELVFKVSGNGQSAEEFTVIAGDLLCRVRGTVVRVSRGPSGVRFHVVEGVVTTYNKQTGEIMKVAP